MFVLLDLDGTLINTASTKYKEYKDGVRQISIEDVPVFAGAREFVATLTNQGHKVYIISDSYPSYVKTISENIFHLEYLALSDKPNSSKTLRFLSDKGVNVNNDEIILVGDSSLDIHLGRKLRCKTIYLQLYNQNSEEFDENDGIDERTTLKYGPTYFAKNYNTVLEIVNFPLQHLLAIEGAALGLDTCNAVRFWNYKAPDHIVAIRCLARQENGACDKMSQTKIYYQIDNPERTAETLDILAKGASSYLASLLRYSQHYKWDIFTYVPDKTTTTPPNKMKEIFNLIETTIPKGDIFSWSDNIRTSLRQEKNYHDRSQYIDQNLKINSSNLVLGKNIIVIDDQLTTGATAFAIRKKLKENGANNILFITLFYMILEVKDDKICPKCGKPLSIKVNRRNGNKFYSCQPERYGGDGCGYIENID